MLLSAVPVSASVAEKKGSLGKNVTYELHDDGHLVISGSGKMDTNFLGRFPFLNINVLIKKVTIEEGVTNIPNGLFRCCKKIEEINIPASVTEIGLIGFAESNLARINLSADNLNYKVEDNVLFNAEETVLLCYPAKKAGTSYSIPDTVETIYENAFKDNGLAEINIPASVSVLSASSFADSTALEKVKFAPGSKLTQIGEWCFRNCTKLTDIVIPESVTNIDRYAFDGCSGLKNIVIFNPECVIADSEYTIPAETKIYGITGSTAEKYAASVSGTFCSLEQSLTGNGHLPEHIGNKDATCTEDGIKEHYRCILTDKLFLDAGCENEITGADIIIKATGHKWDAGNITKAPTCKEDGVMTYTCTVCQETRTETIPATGNHTWDEGKVTKEPTCTENGVMTYTCTVCGQTKTEAIPRTGIPGDMDGSGDITSADARIILRASVNLETLSAELKKLADVDGNGKIDASDARIILRMSVGLK